MSFRFPPRLLLPGLVLALASCGPVRREAAELPPAPVGMKKETATRWQAAAGRWQVTLLLEDRGWVNGFPTDGVPMSFYAVTYHGPHGDARLRTGGMLSRRHVKLYETLDPAQAARITVSAEGDTLILDEEVDTEAGPGNNWTCIRADDQGRLRSFLFQLPLLTKVEAISTYPRVTGMRGGVIYYADDSRKTGSVRVADVPHAEKLTSP